MEFCIPRYLTAQQIQTSETVEYSTPIELYNFENGELIGSEVFVFDGGELIGKIDLYPTDDGYSSVFDTGITDEIAEAYSENISIALGYYDDGLWLYSENDGFVYVDGMKNSVPENKPSILHTISILGRVHNTTYDVISEVDNTATHSSRSIASSSLNVQYVPNSTACDPKGQCSEACVAMLIGYHYNLTLTADNVWNDLNGTKYHSQVPYEALKYYGYDPTYANSAMSANQVYSALKNNCPVIASLKNSTGTKKHAVVIYKIEIDASSSTYTFHDPNTQKIKSFTTSGNPSVISSSLSYGPYTEWYRYTY